MSRIPHFIYLRKPKNYGNVNLIDLITFDGLTDVYNNILMGNCVEKTVNEMNITRQF